MPNNSAPMICDSSLPITPKENWLRAIHREKPLWMPTYDEVQTFVPDVIPDNVVRGMIFEKNTRFPFTPKSAWHSRITARPPNQRPLTSILRASLFLMKRRVKPDSPFRRSQRP